MKKTLKAAIYLIIYTMIIWSAGWVSVRTYDSIRMANVGTPETGDSMFTMINKERAKVGAPPVVFDDRLAKAAKAKSCDMKDRNYFDHADPDGIHGWHYLLENDVFYQGAGENIAKNKVTANAEQAMRGFMNSKGHRELILDPTYKSVGYASCGVYTTQYFIK